MNYGRKTDCPRSQLKVLLWKIHKEQEEAQNTIFSVSFQNVMTVSKEITLYFQSLPTQLREIFKHSIYYTETNSDENHQVIPNFFLLNISDVTLYEFATGFWPNVLKPL